jgi:hypothetical protein
MLAVCARADASVYSCGSSAPQIDRNVVPLILARAFDRFGVAFVATTSPVAG